MKVLFAFLSVIALAVAPPVQRQLLDNPVYLSWAQYKPGTTVTVRATITQRITGDPNDSTVKNQSQPSVGTMVEKLLSVSPDAVVIETTQTTQNGDDKPTATVSQHTIAARVDQDEIGKVKEAAEDVAYWKELKTGTDTMEIVGEKLQTITYEREAVALQPGSIASSKTWIVANPTFALYPPFPHF